jgi:oligoribonuclease
MITEPHAKYLFLDFETTGLVAVDDLILEVAAVITNQYLEQIGPSFQSLVWNVYGPTNGPHHDLILEKNDFVREMHTKNGLLQEFSFKGAPRLSHVEQDLIDFTNTHAIPRVDKLILAGSTIGFDRGFMKVHMPILDKVLHYRQRDVSSDKMLFRDALGMEFPKAEAHRALPDVMESLGQARQMFEKLRSMKELSDAWCRHVGES